jgi:hypothetical protein
VAVGPYWNTEGRDAVNYTAQGEIGKHLLVKFGTADNTVTLAVAATDKIIGCTSDIDAADGEPCDVFCHKIARVIYGTAVAKGDILTANAAGRAVPTVTPLDRVIGIAKITGIAGDIGSVAIFPSIV